MFLLEFQIEFYMSQSEPLQGSSIQSIDENSEASDKAVGRDPLLACLLLMTRLKDSPCSETSLIAGLPLVDQRLSPELFVRAASRAGLEARVVKRRLDDISSIVLPVVLLIEDDHAIVLKQIDETKQAALIIDALNERENKITLSDLKSKYSGYAIYVKSEERFDQAQDLSAKLPVEHWFWSVMKSSWRIYRDVLLASFFINLFAVATPLFVMNVYDRVVPNQAIETLWVLAIGVIIVYIFDLILKGLRGYFIEVAGKKSDILLSSFLFERVLGSRFSERPNSVGSFASQFREFDTVRNFYTSSTIAALVDIPFIILFLLIIFYVGGPIVWVPIAALPIILIYGLLMQKPIKNAVEQTFVSSAQKNATLIESLVGLETVKVLGAEGYLQRVWEKSVGHMAYWSQRVRILSMSVGLFSGLIQQLASVVLIIVGVYLIAERELTMGALIASFMLAGRAMGPIAQVASLLVSYDQTKTALSALDDIVAKTQERNPEKPFIKRPSFEGGIQFNKVTFHYPDERQAALDNVSFKIEPGEKVAIIGRIGSGKSTIQKLLLGLYQPDQGGVLFDGIDNQQIDPADLRRHIGHVPQDLILFSGSVKSNIVYGSPHVGDEEIIRVASLSGVKEFVDRHPLGFDRQVGERGQALSGGQRQSIGIARALLSSPSMCLMDEPTNGMDNSTESLVKDNLLSALEGKTIILVTHKTSLLSLVDRVIVLDNGRLIADGAKEPVLDALKKGQLRVS
ncbi:MAG: ATP-binding cassette subfamily C protein LapB [Cellvibrionaceae bacterium]